MSETRAGNGYECVEPEVGKELWRRSLPGTDPGLLERLDDHVAVCDACRIELAVERRVAAGLREGTLRLERGAGETGRGRAGASGRRPRQAGAILLRMTGGAAIAASLALALLFPPRVPGGGRISRGAEGVTPFLRPVENEMILAGGASFSWETIAGASAYRLTVREVGGDYAWSAETDRTVLRVPSGRSLPVGRRFRAFLEPIPADLAPAGGYTLTFRSGGRRAWLVYRVTAAPFPAIGLAAAGLALVALSAFRRRERPAAA